MFQCLGLETRIHKSLRKMLYTIAQYFLMEQQSQMHQLDVKESQGQNFINYNALILSCMQNNINSICYKKIFFYNIPNQSEMYDWPNIGPILLILDQS